MNRWETLSDGERKRGQIGTALWFDPDLLAADEPSNHLDLDAREILFSALQLFKGIGLIVTHDRVLLENLCNCCLFIDPPDVRIYHGRFSEGLRQLQLEAESQKRTALLTRKAAKKTENEYIRRRQVADKADRKRSKRNLGKKVPFRLLWVNVI